MKRIRTHGIVLACALLSGPRAFALNPSLNISQYAHTAWKVRDGFSKGRITSVAQTRDGYLWLGTEFGLLRFDGVRNVPWQPPAGQQLPNSFIRYLLTARDGRLWIGTIKGLASWKDGTLSQYGELAGQSVDTLLEDREGTLWAGMSAVSTGGLCAIRHGRTQCYGSDGSLGRAVESLYEDSKGNLWVGAATGLWRWNPGPPKHYPPDLVFPTSQVLNEGDNGVLLIATDEGIKQLIDGKVEPYPPAAGQQFTPHKLFRDRDGGLWVGTGKGLAHVHEGRTDLFARSEGLSGDYINRFFEDREGNVWVVTNSGLDRFREFAVATFSTRAGASSVLATRDGSVWIGTLDGLYRWTDQDMIVDIGFPKKAFESLFQDNRGRIWVSTQAGVSYLENGRIIAATGGSGLVIRSIVEDSQGNLWLANQNLGLVQLRRNGEVQQSPWARLGHQDYASALAANPSGGLWVGFVQGGIAYFVDGEVRAAYAARDGLGEGRVNAFHLDRDGTLWAATPGGLSRLKRGRLNTLTSQHGLPCDEVNWAIEDDTRSFWLDTACGLVRIARPELDAWSAEADKGRDPKRAISVAVFDNSEGVRSKAIPVSAYTPQVAKAHDGKLWFATDDGVSVVDPRHLPFNNIPPPVHVERIVADRKEVEFEANGRASLPALTRDLQIDYTALSLVVPEKNRFKVKLEGWDRDWQDAATRRQAFYTNLPPRNYRFRVIASNNSGVWNETGASLEFSIAPAYYQTLWFRLSVVAAFLSLLGALYQLRQRQIVRQFNMRLEERVSERTLIARDLHDTLLQSFHGVVLRFQAAALLLPDRPVDAQKALASGIDQASEALAEGRDAVQGLRSSMRTATDLTSLMTAIGEELSADRSDRPAIDFRVQVEGTPRDLGPLTGDEIYRIAREALRNAYQHADATRIVVEIRYDARQFRLRVRDDGKGMDQQIVDAGRAGHYGLTGMRERAKSLRGTLTIWSELDSGTEVELTIPGLVAYATGSPSKEGPSPTLSSL